MADTLHGAVGKVATGFSHPMVADYSANGGTITLKNPVILARGVDVQIQPNAADENNFYADNQMSESAPSKFTGGTLNVTVDGLLPPALQRINGLPEADKDGWTNIGDSAESPYLAFGYITRYMSGGIVSYQPTIILKNKFNQIESSVATQEDAIDWQTQSLTASIYRGDDANHNWKYLGNSFATEQEAIDALETKMGKSAA